MKVDGGIGALGAGGSGGIAAIGAAAKAQEDLGYDGIWSAETSHDPFYPLLIAAEHTEKIEVGSGIAVAFARSPMTLANTAWDLQGYSDGRFILGIGSQIKAHIEKRFSMPWSHPAVRMREFVLAMRAIWANWQDGTPLQFEGEFYRHTLMTPFFNPGPIDCGPPKVFLAAVGEKMTEVAGEVADGLLIHPFTTERYLREVTLPALERGLVTSGRTLAGFPISYAGLIATGGTDERRADAQTAVRGQIAFYGSTPAYRPVLELHGWGALQSELNALSRQGEWQQMGALIKDDMAAAFSISARPNEVGAEVIRRFGDVISRFSIYAPYVLDDDARHAIVASIRAASPR